MEGLVITVRGRVQGVGFRYAARREAEKCGVTGFARNNPDGSVYIEAVGAKQDVERFLAWCRKGPWFAKVESVASEWRADLGVYDGFTAKE